MRLHVDMCTNLENSVQTAPGQCQLYIEVEVMKTLSGHRAPRCYKYEFRDKTMEYLNVIELEHSGLND